MGMSGGDMVVAAIGVSAVIAAGYSIHRAYKSVRAWLDRMWDLARAAFSDAVDASSTGHLVRYHLGPNGTTPPMHQRVSENQTLEKLHHEQNTKLLGEVCDRLTAVEQGQTTAASVAEDTARRANEGET
jgi:hypothetical protein